VFLVFSASAAKGVQDALDEVITMREMRKVRARSLSVGLADVEERFQPCWRRSVSCAGGSSWVVPVAAPATSTCPSRRRHVSDPKFDRVRHALVILFGKSTLRHVHPSAWRSEAAPCARVVARWPRAICTGLGSTVPIPPWGGGPRNARREAGCPCTISEVLHEAERGVGQIRSAASPGVPGCPCA
jgi:hypothetical protein